MKGGMCNFDIEKNKEILENRYKNFLFDGKKNCRRKK